MSLPATADVALIDALTASGGSTRLYQPALWTPSFPAARDGDWTLRRLGAGLMQGYWGRAIWSPTPPMPSSTPPSPP